MMRRALAALLLITACSTQPSKRPAPPRSGDLEDQNRLAVETLRNAVSSDPTDGARIYVLAQYLDHTGDTGEALKWLGELDRIAWTHGVNDHDFARSAQLPAYRTIA